MLALTRTMSARNNRIFPARALGSLSCAKHGSAGVSRRIVICLARSVGSLLGGSRRKLSRYRSSHLPEFQWRLCRSSAKLRLVRAQEHPDPHCWGPRKNPGEYATTPRASVELLDLRAGNSTPRSGPQVLVWGQSGRGPVEVGAPFARLNPMFHSRPPVIESGCAPRHCF
jgi:hypothetical protein